MTGAPAALAAASDANFCPERSMNRLLKSTWPSNSPIGGMITSSTSELTILPKATPMMIPTARSTTFPLTANSRNSLRKPDIGENLPSVAPGRSSRPARGSVRARLRVRQPYDARSWIDLPPRAEPGASRRHAGDQRDFDHSHRHGDDRPHG